MSQASMPGMERVAQAALELVTDGMALGLGTGRAAEAFIRGLGERVRGGLRVSGVATSLRSEELARTMGIELVSLEDTPSLDIAFDGADEVTPALDLMKGLGGALLRERVVASLARRFVVLVTPEKRVPALCTRAPVPIEIVPFAVAPVRRSLAALGADPVVRLASDGAPYRTDNGNAIVDARFAPLADAATTDRAIRALPGVVDTGMFLGMAQLVWVGEDDGLVRLERV
ncbi:MAG: ribose-5-phosphate isomerase RpiA [Myxococcales bacterium]|nr:ribose-5-phosphate isomerase RpiA [Myxococcales bacterium]